MIRVGFNAYLLSDGALRGWNRYAVNLLAALPAHGVRPVLYSVRPVHPDHLARLPAGSFDAHAAALRYPVWEHLWLPWRCRADRLDVLHSPFNYGLPAWCPVPRVLTIHDAIDEVYYISRLGRRGRWSRNVVQSRFYNWLSRRVADHVITVSGHARGDIARHFRVPPRRLTVVYEAADPGFHAPVRDADRAAARAKYGLARPFVFYVGGLEGRKNAAFLVCGFAAAGADAELVLAGGGEADRETLGKLAAGLGVGDRVRFLGYVPDADLPGLYSAALGFVYPSEYEGFGLQLVEAMAVGCPVLAARATCLPEVLGDGGDTFALGDPAELAGLLRRLVGDAGYRAALAARAARRSADFSWDRTAAETAAVYRRVLARVRKP